MQIHDQMYDSIGEDLATFKNLYNSFPNVAKGFPWLYSAARNGSIELIEFLLQSGHSPDEQDGGRIAQSAITAAAGEASKRSLQLLLSAGASLKVDSLDDNPLIRSIQKFSLECVQLLVDAGIDIHKTYTLEDGRLRNALEFAVSRGCTDIADYLRSEGAVMPGENAKPQSRLYDQLNSKPLAWFQTDTPKSAGSIGLGKNFGQAELRWFDMSSMDHPFLTLFTLGLSEHLLATPAFGTVEARVELMMHLPFTWPMDGEYAQDPQFQWPLNWIRTLPQHILSGSIPLPGTHVIISNDEPPVPLGPGTEQTSLLLIADFYQCFPIETSEGQKIHFYHVVPLYTEERDFEKANGMQPLLEAMAAKGLESLVVHPDRERFVN
jgi:hypothetical protein